MVLHDLELLDGRKVSLATAHRKIAKVCPAGGFINEDPLHLHFQDCIAFPGLINSHEHLEFNLFPQLGNKIYQHYTEWGPDIHTRNHAVISAVLKVPKELRAQWGVYKNLLCGVTTVVQHGQPLIPGKAFIDVFNNCHSLHSVRLEKYWRQKLNNPFRKERPYVIHLGEGTNSEAHNEINKLICWNLLRRNIVAVHGVAMDMEQANKFKALVWCPDSNFFLLGKTADIKQIKRATTIVFGTDSCVSSHWNIWEHIRLARKTQLVTDEELLASLFINASKVWQLKTGVIQEEYDADIVVAKKKDKSAPTTENFFSLNPEDLMLVVSKGEIVLFDISLRHALSHLSLEHYSCVKIGASQKFVAGKAPSLVQKIKEHWPEATFPIEID